MYQESNQQIKSTNKLAKKGLKKYSILLFITLCAVIGSVVYAMNNNSNNKTADNILDVPTEIIVQTQIVSTSTAESIIALSGVTKPLAEVKVSAKMSGRLARLYVDEGDFVKKGQLIFQLEQDQALLANYNTAFNNYNIAQKNLDNTILSTQRDVEVAEIGVTIAQESLDSTIKSLSNNDTVSEVSLNNTYETAKQKSDASLLTVNNALTVLENIIDDYTISNSNFFPTSNSQAYNDFRIHNARAKLEYNNTLDYYNSIKYIATQEDIDKLLIDITIVLDKTSIALDDMRVVLDYGITGSGSHVMTKSQLTTIKSNVQSNQANVDTSLLGIKIMEQSILTIKTTNNSSDDSVQSAVVLAEQQLEAARKTLESARIKAQIQINSVQGQVEAAEGQLNVISATLGDTSIVSPIDGIVNQQFANAGEITMAGTPVIAIVNIDDIEIDIALTEFDIGRVSTDQIVNIKLSAYPEEKFLGQIYYVSAIADASKKFPIKIQLDNSDGRIKAGMLADIEIITDILDDIILIPKISVFSENDINKVYTLNNSIVKVKEIKTQEADDENLFILEGLEIGDEIVINGNFNFSDGSIVNIKNN